MFPAGPLSEHPLPVVCGQLRWREPDFLSAHEFWSTFIKNLVMHIVIWSCERHCCCATDAGAFLSGAFAAADSCPSEGQSTWMPRSSRTLRVRRRSLSRHRTGEPSMLSCPGPMLIYVIQPSSLFGPPLIPV
jgi:hypothetical protein